MYESQSTRRPPESRHLRTQTPKPAANATYATRHGAAQYAASEAASPSIAEVMAMQQQLGNRAVSQLLQRKLTIGPADDAHEREAELVSSQVMKGPAPERGDERATGLADKPGVERAGDAQGGRPLPHATRDSMEARFGADFSHVRVHTGSEPARVNRALDAEAFTHQNHIYMGAGEYNPHSQTGQQLLAHELTHVMQQAGTVRRKSNKPTVSVREKLPAQRVSTKRKKLYLDFIRMKRLDPQFDKIIASKLGMKKLAEKKGDQSGGTYGHWWTEIGDMQGAYPGTWQAAESYGWWPKTGVGGKRTFKGVEGALNAGNADDPHHGEDVKSDQMFHPVMELDATATDYAATRSKVIDDVRRFSKGYSGKWNWVLGWGKNCHTFQQALKTAVGLHYQKGAGWLKKPEDVAGVAETAQKEKKHAANERWNAENPGIDYKLTDDVPVESGMMGEGGKTDLPKDSIVRVLTEGIDINRVQGWNKVAIACDQKYYQAYYDDVTKHAERV